jgi:uncharacterized protein (TIGR02300 family)
MRTALVVPRVQDDNGGRGVAKVDLGMKLTCESCGARFYDLNKQPGICPKCGTANARPVIFKASRRPSAEDREKAAQLAKAPPKPAPADEDVAADATDDEDEDVIEDTSDLGEDDDDVEVPVEKDEPKPARMTDI